MHSIAFYVECVINVDPNEFRNLKLFSHDWIIQCHEDFIRLLGKTVVLWYTEIGLTVRPFGFSGLFPRCFNISILNLAQKVKFVPVFMPTYIHKINPSHLIHIYVMF